MWRTRIDPSRTFAPGTRSGDYSVRAGPVWSLHLALAAGSGAAAHRPQRKPAAIRDHGPTRRADGPADDVLCASCLHAFPSLVWGQRARMGARPPARSIRLGRGHRAGGVTPIEQDTGPAVKTSSPCLPPRDAQCAVGGIRAWGEIPAAGPANFDCTPIWSVCVRGPQMFGADVSAAIGGVRC